MLSPSSYQAQLPSPFPPAGYLHPVPVLQHVYIVGDHHPRYCPLNPPPYLLHPNIKIRQDTLLMFCI